MSADQSVDSCPHCGTRIPETQVLIEYETVDGRKRYSECPQCLEVVHPE